MKSLRANTTLNKRRACCHSTASFHLRYSLQSTNLLWLELSKAKLKFKMLTNTSVASEAFAGPPFQKEEPNPLFLESPFPLLQEMVFLSDLVHGLATATPELRPSYWSPVVIPESWVTLKCLKKPSKPFWICILFCFYDEWLTLAISFDWLGETFWFNVGQL